jgi:hypothetical protein
MSIFSMTFALRTRQTDCFRNDRLTTLSGGRDLTTAAQ